MKIGPTTLEDTFAEAFSMRYGRIIVTAANERWLSAAIAEFSGYGSSVIGCDAEVGLEHLLSKSETLDGRPGASLLVFGFSTDAVAKAISNRTGQCLMTCPTTAVFDGLGLVANPESTESANAAEAKSTVFVTGISDLLAAVTFGEHNEAAALCLEGIDIPIHAPAGGGSH